MLNFVAARQLAHVLSSRARVHLALGDSSASFEDLETLGVLMKSLALEPGNLVSTMIHIAVAGLYLETVEDGLREKLWADAELQRLVRSLRAMNLLEVAERGIRSERAAILRTLDALALRRRDPLYSRSLDLLTFEGWTKERVIIQFSPSSWVRRNQAQYAELIQGYLDGIDSTRRRIHLRQIDSATAGVNTATRSPKNALLTYVTPNFSKAAATIARNQARADQLALACALERYRIRHGSYPQDIRQLVPEFIEGIPHELQTGDPLGYNRLESGYELIGTDSQMMHTTAKGNFIWQGN
jgi:hypothetical protein